MKGKKWIGIFSAVVVSCLMNLSVVQAKERDVEIGIEKTPKVRLIVTYQDNVSEEAREEALDQSGVDKQNVVENFTVSQSTVIEVSQEDANEIEKQLEEHSDVVAVSPDYQICIEDFDISAAMYQPKKTDNFIITDPYYTYQWGLKNTGQAIYQWGTAGIDTNIEQAWSITSGSEEVLVGVLDAGIDIDNIDLCDNIYVNRREIVGNGIDDDNNGYVDDVNGWDFYHDDATVFDSLEEDSHGTYIASIIGAPRNEIGMVGVSPNVKIVPLKFMSTVDGGNTSDAIRAIEYASELGVKVINCSWIGTEYNHALKEAMRHSGILFVCASGNQGKNIDLEPVYPACFNIGNVITVGAINSQGDMVDYSNYGKKNVDVLAPGDGILGQLPNNMLILSDGTSAAAPFVTGEAALLYSIKPNLQGSKMADYIRKAVVKDKENYQQVKSRGRIDIYQALQYTMKK